MLDELALDRALSADPDATLAMVADLVHATDETLRPGTSGTVHGPCGVSVAFTVLDVDHEKRRWSWEVEAVGITLTLHHSVRLSNAKKLGGSATTLVIDGPAPVVAGYAPVARIALGRLVR